MSEVDPQVSRYHFEEVLKPILYGDIFDYPLTFQEIYRFLEIEATPDQLKGWLDQAVQEKKICLIDDNYYSLVDRTHLAAKRQERWLEAQKLWPAADFYGRWIASLPFVKMVAVTGALAVENPRDARDDIDYLIVTRPGRLWLCRAFIILLVRLAQRRGVHLCPNYLLTENILYFVENNLFTAREMLQMVPLYGKSYYLDMRDQNDWVTNYLPQGTGLNLSKVDDRLSPWQRFLKKSSEIVLGGFLGDWIEKPLQKFQINKHKKLAQKYDVLDKVIFTPDQCKGHYDGHNTKTMKAYRRRIRKGRRNLSSQDTKKILA